jgi:B12-binding domain/radical SAM domain protein
VSQPDFVLLHAPSVYDFRRESILYGPVSDLVPSTTVFEMYPIGFTTLADYLERHGMSARIVNLAVRMLREPAFDPARLIGRLDPVAFGIDLHWMPHAHGALEVAKLVKARHPHTPVIFGGFSSSYFHRELVQRPEVDYVLRGDSTELPLCRLMGLLKAGRANDETLAEVPNLTWLDSAGQVRENPITYSPTDLDHVIIDYSYVVRSVVRYADLAGVVPFKDWLNYPITAALTVRGCSFGCKTCGGSAAAFRRIHQRQRPAFRSPAQLAEDLRNIRKFSNGPIFILGDLRQAGMDYAQEFFDHVGSDAGPVIVELFMPADRDYVQRLAATFPNFTMEISPESHSDEVRQAFGRPYTTSAIEETMAYVLEAGCRRLDIFFMIGLPKQDYDSVMDTVRYCEHLLERFDAGADRRLFPFISPLAPFIDPGSDVFEQPAEHGYRLLYRTLEEHRQALVAPSWKYVLNYETQWMTRDQIAEATYEAGLRLNRLKARYGLIAPAVAAETEERIRRARRLMAQIDDIMSIEDAGRRALLLRALKPQVDMANHSTVCEKSELNLPVGLLKLNVLRAAGIVLAGLLGRTRRPAASEESEPC